MPERVRPGNGVFAATDSDALEDAANRIDPKKGLLDSKAWYMVPIGSKVAFQHGDTSQRQLDADVLDEFIEVLVANASGRLGIGIDLDEKKTVSHTSRG